MTININFSVSGFKEKALNKIATQNSMTPSEYVETTFFQYLENRAKEYYSGKFNALTIQEMIQTFGDIE